MKHFTQKLIMAVALLLITTQIATAQTPSTVGDDFYVMFLRNDKNFPLSNSSTYFPGYLRLIMTSENACSGTITSTNGSFTKDFTVTPGQITEINIPKNSYPDKQAGYSYKSGTIEDKGLHVTATEPISLYAVNYCDASFDITNVLPTPALGDEYIIQNYKGTQISSGKYSGSSFVIVATEDNTTIDVTPTALTGVQTPGQSSQSETYSIGQPITVTLNAGQSYQLMAKGLDSFDGTRIKARDCKKIAVFQGNSITGVPGPITTNGWGYGDHLYEQSIPVEYWGKKFIVTQSLQRANDRVKITSSKDNCEIKVNGNVLTTINAYETYEFEIVKDAASDIIDYAIDKVYGTAHYIETSEPTSVFLYMTSREYGSAAEEIGDPSMVLVTPIEQQIDYITFGTFQTDRIEFHHLNITTLTESVSKMYLDNVNIASSFTTVPGNTAYSYARIDIEQGSHTLQNLNGGFTAHVYGFGQGTGRDESYAYTVGTGVKDINKQMYINNTPITLDLDSYSACSNENLDFLVTTSYEHGNITWHFGDGTTGTGDETSHSFDTEGEYFVEAVIEREGNYCQENQFDTLKATIIIGKSIEYTQDYSLCSGSEIMVNDVPYNSGGTYTQTIETGTGCDSILTLNIVEVNETAEVVIVGDSIVRINGSTYGISLTTGEETLIDSVAWSIGYEEWTVTPTDDFGCIVNTNEMYPETTPVMLTVTTYNACGSYTTSIGLHYEGEGIEENTANATIFPNPTSGKLNIKADAMKQIRIIDVIGQVLTDKAIDTDDITIDMSQYGNGIYLVEVTTQNGKALKRIVVR